MGFFKGDERYQVMYTNFMNYGHLFGPLVIDKLWLLFNVFFYQKCSCANYRQLQLPDYTSTPPPNQCQPWTHLRPQKSTAHLANIL